MNSKFNHCFQVADQLDEDEIARIDLIAKHEMIGMDTKKLLFIPSARHHSFKETGAPRTGNNTPTSRAHRAQSNPKAGRRPSLTDELFPCVYSPSRVMQSKMKVDSPARF
jgi:hypothetical protein